MHSFLFFEGHRWVRTKGEINKETRKGKNENENEKNKTSNTFALWVEDIRASRPLFRKKGDIKKTLLHYEKIS